MTSGPQIHRTDNEADQDLITTSMPHNIFSIDHGVRSIPITIPGRSRSESQVKSTPEIPSGPAKSSSAPEPSSTANANNSARQLVNTHPTSPNTTHIIHLSSVEHCMPRAYIRVCLAFRLPPAEALDQVVLRLNEFIRRTVDAKPYLAGYVVPSSNISHQAGHVEISFTNDDFLGYPPVEVRRFTTEEMPYTYDDLCHLHLPPSLIRPELVSALPEGADDNRAPVFRAQANVVDGGIIVSFYLHHCISDGTGLGLLVTGSVLTDDFAFDRHMDPRALVNQGLSQRLEAFANQMSAARTRLSWSSPNQVNSRQIDYRIITSPSAVGEAIKPAGRGCVFALSREKLAELGTAVGEINAESYISPLDVLQTLLWHHMTQARIPSLADAAVVASSKLLIPVNIRKKLKEPLSESYFGSAVDFAGVQMGLQHLSKSDYTSFAETACNIRRAIQKVDEAYIRQAIAMARMQYANVDVRDLLASNMNRATGADMYVTSWEKLKLYDATLDLGLGRPDWIRKPWSKDPGSCIVLPDDDRKPYTEVVIQMTVPDMGRLLEDQAFMQYVMRVVE